MPHVLHGLIFAGFVCHFWQRLAKRGPLQDEITKAQDPKEQATAKAPWDHWCQTTKDKKLFFQHGDNDGEREGQEQQTA